MKINKIVYLITLGLLLTAPACFAWTIDNGINNNTGGGTTAYEPVATPAAGAKTSSQSVVLSANGASSIRYTTDGSTPTCTVGNIYSEAFTVNSNQTIKAISCYADNGSTSASNVSSHTYTFSCPTIANAASYNAYPTCGPASCNSGYILSSNSCVVSGGGGGGGGGYTTYSVNASAGANGSISPSGSIAASYGSSKTFTITPASGYSIYNVVVDGNSMGAISTYTFSNIGSSHTIVASFSNGTDVPAGQQGGQQTAGGSTNCMSYITVSEQTNCLINLIAQLTQQINQILAQTGSGTPTSGGATGGQANVFTQALAVGSSGSQVILLQDTLKKLGFLSKSIVSNGYFGPATLKAVQDFQVYYNIAKLGVVGYGQVGPKTRQKLNQLY